MAVLGTLHTQIAGLNKATAKVADAGERVARGKPLDPNAMVDLATAERSFQANVKAIQATDQMTGVLLDIRT